VRAAAAASAASIALPPAATTARPASTAAGWVVLTAGTGSDADLIASHVRLAAMSTNSAHRVIDSASHQELLADEKDSAATSQAVLDVVAAIRNATPLAQ
jgi:hypothetical protein